VQPLYLRTHRLLIVLFYHIIALHAAVFSSLPLEISPATR
jgi:hypothetical protein